VRGQKKYRHAFIRFESPPGKQMQIDWGHFGSLRYEDTMRKLYALAVIECYSRMLYVEFTHSQKQEALHHIICRGIERGKIFKDDIDRNNFVDRLASIF
jgi:transposase